MLFIYFFFFIQNCLHLLLQRLRDQWVAYQGNKIEKIIPYGSRSSGNSTLWLEHFFL